MNETQPNNQPLENEAQKVKRLRCPLTPFQLFSPVSTVFEQNMSQEEQILGLYKQFNQFVTNFNALVDFANELQKLVQDIPEQIENMQTAIDTLRDWTARQLIQITADYKTGDENTLAAAKKYTDEEIAKLPDDGLVRNPITGTITSTSTALEDLFGLHRGEALTAGEYDALELTAEAYDERELTAFDYDMYGKMYLGVYNHVV